MSKAFFLSTGNGDRKKKTAVTTATAAKAKTTAKSTAQTKPSAASTPQQTVFNPSTKTDEVLTKKNLVAAQAAANQNAAKVKTSTSAKSTSKTETSTAAPRTGILQTVFNLATKTDEPATKKNTIAATRAAALAASMKSAYDTSTAAAKERAASLGKLLSRGTSDSKAAIFNPHTKTDVPLTKKNLVAAQAEKKKEQKPIYNGEILNDSKVLSQTKYGTIARPLPTAKDEIYQLVSDLSDDFPFEKWDTMTSDEQRKEIERTGLTKEEQWVLLNATEPLGTIRLLQDIQNDKSIKWSSVQDKNDFLTELWHIGCAKHEINTHSHQFSYDARSSKILYDLLEKKEQKLLEMDGSETLLGGYEGTLLDYKEVEMYPKSASNKNNAPYRVNENGEIENNTIVILYTSGYKANFSRHAKYHAEMLQKKGYRTETHKVNTVDAFTHQWDNMDDSVKAVIILAHSNGNALILKHNTSKEALSIDGKNSKGEKIGDLRDLKGPYIDELYLLSCNTSNESLYNYGGTNVSDTLRDKLNINRVYGFDGSMGFGESLKNILPNASLYPRLSNGQDRYYAINDKYKNYLSFEEDDVFLEPSGLYMYDSEVR